MEAESLECHTIDFLIPELDQSRLSWLSKEGGRLRRSALGRRIVPPLRGGASRELDERLSRRSQSVFLEYLTGVKEDELAEVTEHARAGYELQRERNATVEQRANFFLGAAGLSSTLVLANASILLGVGEGALHSPWRQLTAAAFAFASVCAIFAGIRAMQAVMLTFERISPDGVGSILSWDQTSGPGRVARNLASALLVAQERELRVCEWKLDRLREARRWFGGAVLGVVVVTGFVLVEVL
jgi:hypothetical protein